MRRLTVTNSESGFTLLEQLIVLVLVGILGALTTPSLLGMKQRQELNEAVSSLRSSLQEVQRQAIMKSQTCTISLPTSGFEHTKTTPFTITLDTDTTGKIKSSCFVISAGQTLNNMKIIHDYTSNQIQFDFKGQSATTGLIRLEHSKNSSLGEKCIQISQPLGLVRVGDYNGSSCVAAQ